MESFKLKNIIKIKKTLMYGFNSRMECREERNGDERRITEITQYEQEKINYKKMNRNM